MGELREKAEPPRVAGPPARAEARPVAGPPRGREQVLRWRDGLWRPLQQDRGDRHRRRSRWLWWIDWHRHIDRRLLGYHAEWRQYPDREQRQWDG